ncbi:MYND-type domain-containing protein [Mycena venus]|uniref:MYND-type domain-containing protein n=1 Tax=Mycena venus TaxID=2733690 RepID=A0A8H6XAU1_9AGAR|nr:MYND-type domain-containing protein [Mycena venus]
MSLFLVAADASGFRIAVQDSRVPEGRLVALIRFFPGHDAVSQRDWELHKPFCKALRAMEKNSLIAATLISALRKEPTTDLKVLNDMTQAYIDVVSPFCRGSLQRPPTLFESNLISGEPRCLVCTRTDQLIRMEAAKNGVDNFSRLIPCPDCHLTFCCSPAHWDVARPLHHSPCEEALDGLSQCIMNRQIHVQLKAKTFMMSARDFPARFMWYPKRIKSAWTSLSGSSWEAEFDDEMRKYAGKPTAHSMFPVIVEASDNLSMAMTVLYGLEMLNDDDGWTRKHTLTVHVIGANAMEANCVIFEEILHHLPQVKILKLVLCGPDMPVRHLSRTVTLTTCSECTELGRQHIQEHVAEKYHTFVRNQGSKFQKPDLCIAFNSGASQVSTHTWLPTFKLLVEGKIPTVFTSFNREEAEGEAVLLRAAGAKLHPAVGPTRNPWGSINLRPSPHKVYGFNSDNGWLAGGFR